MSRMIQEALETMRGLHDIGAVNKQTLRDFETQCLPPHHRLHGGNDSALSVAPSQLMR